MVIKPTMHIGLMAIILAVGALALLALNYSSFFSKKTRITKATKKSRVQPANVIFDLNGVLFTVNKGQAVSHLGLFDILSYSIGGSDITKLEDKIFQLLNRMQPLFKTPHCARAAEWDKKLTPMHHDQPLPRIMRDWMQGELSSEEILDKALPFIDTLDEQGFFKNNLEKKLVRKTLKMIFDVDTRCKMYKPIKSGIKLLKKCKDLNHKVYLLSNMDSEFVELLKEKHPDIFGLFDGIVVSADVKAIKPYNSIYSQLIASHNLDPSICYMIDDQPENIEGAKNAGMHGIQCDFNHYKAVRNELRECKVLPKLKQKKLTQTA